MPYNEDGDSWNVDMRGHVEGQAENKAGHKAFVDYKLPDWVKHPMSHPTSGVFVSVKDYAYCSTDPGSGTALDGIGNPLGVGPAHVAGTYGDMEMLESCSPAEINARDVSGKTTAHYAVDTGMSWVCQWLTEKGADTTSEAFLADKQLHSPEELIWINAKNHDNEMAFLDQALKGELTDEKSQSAQEYKLKKWRPESLDPVVVEALDEQALMQRKLFYNTGSICMPYPMPTAAESTAKMDMPSACVEKLPPKSKPPLPVALVFPGQGSQYVGMMKDCVNLPSVQAMLSEAKSILGWDPKDLMLNGPEAQLAETKYCQPCMFIAGMAALEVMKATGKGEEVERVQAVAGLSLGEYTAICAAGILEFGDALKLVKLRAEAMQKATDLTPQSMCSVAGLDRPTLEKCCKDAIAADKSTKSPICQIANFLFPAGFSVAGTKETIAKLIDLAMKARALQARLIKAGGAFHCPLMQPAQSELAAAIEAVAPKMKPPRCSIYFNINAKKVSKGEDPASFAAHMKMQLTSEVLWEPTVKQMIIDGVKDFYECGPLKQLKAMIKRIDQDAFKRTENIAI